MRSSCVICSDLFEEFASIVATPCGHVFHEKCILQWLDCSKTCPECRNKVLHKSLNKLFFNIAVNDQASQDCLENEVAALQAKLREKDMEISNIRQQKEETRKFVKIAEQKAADLEQEVYKLKSEGTSLKLIHKDIKSRLHRLNELESANKSLINKVEMFQNVQTVLTGTQKDVDEMLSTMPSGPDSIRSIVTYCSLLKRELKQASESKQDLRNEIANLRKINAIHTVKIRQLNDQVEQMKEQMLSLENENTTLMARLESMKQESSNHLGNSHNAVVTYESPAPERLKNAAGEEILVTPVAEQNNPDTVPKRRRLGFCAPCEYTLSVPMKSVKLPVDSRADVGTILKQQRALEKNNENSTIRNGYDGLGGHSNFIVKSKSTKFKPPSKR